MKKQYVQYGCGEIAPDGWINFDASPTLRLQKIPVFGNLIKPKLNTVFPENVKYGDIIKGLPVKDNSCDGLFCSHTLEHLSLNDFRKALINSYKILKPGGLFRIVMPDLESYAKLYLQELNSGNSNAGFVFFEHSRLGIVERPRGLKAMATALYGNAHHLWLWDFPSLNKELENAGFKNIRRCDFDDSTDKMFQLVEIVWRFKDAVAVECTR